MSTSSPGRISSATNCSIRATDGVTVRYTYRKATPSTRLGPDRLSLIYDFNLQEKYGRASVGLAVSESRRGQFLSTPAKCQNNVVDRTDTLISAVENHSWARQFIEWSFGCLFRPR